MLVSVHTSHMSTAEAGVWAAVLKSKNRQLTQAH